MAVNIPLSTCRLARSVEVKHRSLNSLLLQNLVMDLENEGIK